MCSKKAPSYPLGSFFFSFCKKNILRWKWNLKEDIFLAFSPSLLLSLNLRNKHSNTFSLP